MTLSTTTIDNASAGRRKDCHRSSLPMRKDNRIAAIGKQKNDMLPTMLWMVPAVVAAPPTSIGKIPARSSDTRRGQGEKAPRKTYQVARCLNRAQLLERALPSRCRCLRQSKGNHKDLRPSWPGLPGYVQYSTGISGLDGRSLRYTASPQHSCAGSGHSFLPGPLVRSSPPRTPNLWCPPTSFEVAQPQIRGLVITAPGRTPRAAASRSDVMHNSSSGA
jgi:hypothetical protein